MAAQEARKLEFMISYTQQNTNALHLSEKLWSSPTNDGHSVWLDVHEADKSEAAMEDAVNRADGVLAIITDNQGVPGNAYFERGFCLKELRWACAAGTFIQPVITAKDKGRIAEFMRLAPIDLQHLRQVDFVDLNWSDQDYWDVGVKKIIQHVRSKPKLRPIVAVSTSLASPQVAPE